jgi:dTDP-4-dehydrorhamnose reductase
MSLELWGGIECTVCRVGDRYVDQIAQAGHDVRLDDLDRMAETGIRTWRYPLLWERIAPDGLCRADWDWADRRMERMGELGLEPIVGLVHHGSGPRSTDLLDPSFPQRLAEYADAVARRYPWVRRWTPVNEPLSTARFSALDGHWYPHARTDETFARAITHECRAIALSMEAIRSHVPQAELVFTEDFCVQSCTPGMREEAHFRSERRWLAIDLVLGRVDERHFFYEWLLAQGADPVLLEELACRPTPIGVLGGNYYLTSDRFLDDLPQRHPRWRQFVGRDGLYGESEAVRCTQQGIVGHRSVLVEAWRRYHLPVALTEVHLGCTREEQVRWLIEAWDAALLARQDGADVRAVTLWGTFGMFGWDKLTVRAGGTYEVGMFDVRGPTPRKTALARVASAIVRGRDPTEEAPYGGAGWWRRPMRMLGHPPISAIELGEGRRLPLPEPRPTRPLLITGEGALAREVRCAAELRGLEVHMPGRSLDPSDPAAVAAELERWRPWAIFHAAGVRSRADASLDPATCERLHADAPGVLAAAAHAHRIRLLVLSSALVVAGNEPSEAREPCPESAPVRPLDTLGAAQALGESRALEHRALVIRCGSIVGTDREDDLLVRCLQALSRGESWSVPAGCPVALATPLVHAALDLLVDGELGVWHLAHRRELLVVCQAAAKLHGLDASRIRGVPGDVPMLVSERGPALPPFGSALRSWLDRRALEERARGPQVADVEEVVS